MAEKVKKDKKSSKVDEVSMSKKDGKHDRPKKDKEGKKHKPTATALSLLADQKTFDPTLSSLFSQPPPVQPRPQAPLVIPTVGDKDESELEADGSEVADVDTLEPVQQAQNDGDGHRKRKRKHSDEDLEDAYLQRLAREEERDAERLAAERATKRPKREALDRNDEDSDVEGGAPAVESDEENEDEKLSSADSDAEMEDDAASPPPKHETQEAADVEVTKANRTVFLGNVSTTAISSKSARKTLIQHLSSFFPETKDGESKHKLESIRFRSTPYAAAIPKKAAYARKEVMDATSKSTNAYVVYSSPQLAREAAKQLNGTVVLERHLRVDEIAHPAKVDNKRCVFVGNLGFVDDESNIQDANEEDGREKRKRSKEPADIEEGLWRTFGRCGNVESVRVIRDSTTRVGKGIAYVQFDDQNAVEAALLYNEKKFPPMLPRKLRVSRAKAQKKNAKPGSGRPGAPRPNANGYQRKMTGEEASQMGRAGKLYGRAGAAKARKPGGRGPERTGANDVKLGDGIRKPEAFVFEGHRASSKSGKSGLKLGGKGKKGKPTTRSAKRGAAYKAGKPKTK